MRQCTCLYCSTAVIQNRLGYARLVPTRDIRDRVRLADYYAFSDDMHLLRKTSPELDELRHNAQC